MMCFFLSDGEGVGAAIVRIAYEAEYGRRIEHGWLVMDHWVHFSCTICWFRGSKGKSENSRNAKCL